MNGLEHLIENNRQWADRINAEDPEFLSQLAVQQSPEYLWIGCADSRVPANEICGLESGDIFVHRNVANVVVHTDLNCLSVIQYAVEVLKVKHIIVCGHYGCGGVRAALEDARFGLIDNWLRHIKDVRDKHLALLENQVDDHNRRNRLCELNAIEQAVNVGVTSIVQDAWEKSQDLKIHAWIYGLKDGHVKDLNYCVSNKDELKSKYQSAVDSIGHK